MAKSRSGAGPRDRVGASLGERTRDWRPLLGEYLRFARTRAEREASGDPRLSLQERYPGGAAELAARRREVARQLVAERILLPADEAEAAAGSLEDDRP